MFPAQFLVLCRFSYCFGQIPGYFYTWTDKIHISRFSRFPGCAGNPGSGSLTFKFIRNILKMDHRYYFEVEQLICAAGMLLILI